MTAQPAGNPLRAPALSGVGAADRAAWAACLGRPVQIDQTWNAYKACWVKWYRLVKAVSPKFRLVWNPNNQNSDAHLDVRKFWPGKAYVDAAGPDAYALCRDGKLMSPDQLGPNGELLGIAAWADWVAARGVPLAVPE